MLLLLTHLNEAMSGCRTHSSLSGLRILRVFAVLVLVGAVSVVPMTGLAQSSESEASSKRAQNDDESQENDDASEDDDVFRIGPSGSESNNQSKEGASNADAAGDQETATGDQDANESGDAKDSEQQGDAESEEVVGIPEVEVIGRAEKDVEAVPGSAEVVSEEELDRQKPLSANEALETVPGVNMQTEDPMGLRQNIGIRGLNPTRSRKVLVLEDGVPIALAPYGEPEMYYSPPIDRMSRIEIVKGSGSILFGPQTIGGVVNYITPQPPDEFELTAEATAGTFGHYTGHVTAGDTNGQVGWWVSGLHKRFEGHRDLNLEMTDVTSKFRLRLDDTQTLSLKFSVYDESSQSTYLGLTTPQFQNNPSANYASNDRFKIRRYGIQATHAATIGTDTLLETRLYGHNVQRNWRRQDFDRTPQDGVDYQRAIDGEGDDILGQPRSSWPTGGSSVYFRHTTGNRNREFTVGGIEPRVTHNWDVGEVESELQAGFRFHVEHTRERRINGEWRRSISGTIRDDDERLGRAFAAYALNEFRFFDEKLKVSPGVRGEALWTERTIYRTRTDDGMGGASPQDLAPPRENDNTITALIPGLGVSYQAAEPLTLFSGVHRGFAPPRTKDAISKEGNKLGFDAEFSWNYEVGGRLNFKDYLSGELTGFLLDFRNQNIAPAESGGTVSIDPEEQDPGELAEVPSGQTIHRGIESGVTFDPATFAGQSWDLPLTLNYTFVDAKFQDGWAAAFQGNPLPYSPDHTVFGRAAFSHPIGLDLQVEGRYISEQYTDKVATVQPTTNGLAGLIDSRFLMNATAQYTHEPTGISAFVTGKNLTDLRYISTRTPRGIKPGLFRHVYGGLRLEY